MGIDVLSPQGILQLAQGREPVIDISDGKRREFILRSPAAIQEVLMGAAAKVTRPSKIFYWRRLMECIGNDGLPLAIRSLKNDYIHSLDIELAPGDIYTTGDIRTVSERKLNLAVLSVMLSGYKRVIPPQSLELFITASDTVERFKSAVNEKQVPGLPDRLFFAQAVADQRDFALDIFKHIGKNMPIHAGDQELYHTFREEVDSIIGILHFSCKNISNAIGWTLCNLTAGEKCSWHDVYPVILESLRLFPPNWLFHRSVMEGFNLCGVTMQDGDLLHISPLLTHRCAEYWDNPNAFMPDRFLRGEKIDPWAYIPFGRSFTKCPGTNLSFKIIRFFVEKIVEENLVTRHEAFLPVLRNTISLNPFPLQGVRLEMRKQSRMPAI